MAMFLRFVCVAVVRLGLSKPATRFSSVQRGPRIPRERISVRHAAHCSASSSSICA